MITNLAQVLVRNCQENPDRTAIISAEDQSGSSFQEFLHQVLSSATGLRQLGIGKGDRVLFLTPPSGDLYAILWACFYRGATSVFVDPNLPRPQILKILKEQKIRLAFSTSRLLRHKWMLPPLWNLKTCALDQRTWGSYQRKHVFTAMDSSIEPENLETSSEALLTFTSGSTGEPKGANRNFATLLNQHLLSQKYWPEDPDEVDMPGFPMVVMQNLACGITTVLPKLPQGSLRGMDPGAIHSQLLEHRVTRLSGSPGFMKCMTDWMLSAGLQYRGLRRLIVGGAQVPAKLAEQILTCFPNADSHVIYGSTEAEPIAFAKLQDVVQHSGPGYLVGHPIPEIQLRIVNLESDLDLQRIRTLGPHAFEQEVGEIIISGPHVIKNYIGNEPANRETKIPHGSEIWHRTGDWGRKTESGAIELLGRKADRLNPARGNLPCLQIEKRLEHLAPIQRAAVLEIDDQLVVALQASSKDTSLELVNQVLGSFQLKAGSLHFVESFPLDHRHQWKIQRAQLKELILEKTR